MCLGVPAKVISVTGEMASVVIGEIEYQANIALLEDIVPGDFIILHAGFGIEKVDPAEAEETMQLIRDIENGNILEENGTPSS